ncbi:MAG: GNAT family N-acetyltransferase [Burkholderia gladioli]
MRLTYSITTEADADTLVAIRIAAMRDSLSRIGRFDPERARERFLSDFDPELCRFIEADGTRAGFLSLRYHDDHWRLGHLYVVPEHQGRGIGAAVLGDLFARADAERMPIRVGALRGSASNRFYMHHGFVRTAETEWDIDYVRAPG